MIMTTTTLVTKIATTVKQQQQARSSHVARVAHAPPLRGLFFFLADAFLDCARHEYKNTDEENEPSGLLFTSSLLAKSGLEVTPLCREATRCTVSIVLPCHMTICIQKDAHRPGWICRYFRGSRRAGKFKPGISRPGGKYRKLTTAAVEAAVI